MISRAVCAPRVCLSCRIGLARRRAGLGAGLLVRYDDSGLRRYASDRSVVQKKDIVEALISGKTSLEDREKAAKREKPRQKKRQQRQKDADDLDWPEADDASFDWKVGLVEEPQKDPTASPPNIRTAAAPDEPFPVERLSWRSAQPKPKALIETSEALLRPEEPKELSDAHESIPGPQEPEETPYINRPVPQPRESETFKDAFLRQEHLSIEALGRRVGALIIKNPNQLHRKGKGSTFLPEPTTPLGDLDWKSMVPTEGAEIDAATEASGHIEELRPTDSLTIPRNHYHKLKEELAFGFTGNQLALYYSQKDKSAAPQPSETPAYPWVVDQTAWKPSTPEFTGKEAKKKHHLARMIMTLQWGLQVQEEVESPGLATVTVRGDIFQLVARWSTP